MESMDVITRVSEPTDWCSGMVVVPKANGKVRICVDLTKLKQNVKRESHILPSVEDTLAQLKDAHLFTKLDANSGFWQIPLTKESSMMTTFITPYGRYRFNRLPFGISSAPEHFQRRMYEILEGLTGLVCLMDFRKVRDGTRRTPSCSPSASSASGRHSKQGEMLVFPTISEVPGPPSRRWRSET